MSEDIGLDVMLNIYIEKLEPELFFSYCKYIQIERGYSSNWARVMFKTRYDKWPSKIIDKMVDFRNPTDDFLTWLDVVYFKSVFNKD